MGNLAEAGYRPQEGQTNHLGGPSGRWKHVRILYRRSGYLTAADGRPTDAGAARKGLPSVGTFVRLTSAPPSKYPDVVAGLCP